MLKIESLEIQGFKSFHEKAEFLFPEGITSIVGPNGCGKSNILDAISWVLGEQNVRTLRGDRMDDLIFSGSEARRPISMAEVSMKLVDGNGAGGEAQKTADEQYVISRRLYRSGESEYLFNGQVCRLKDVHEFLVGKGIGLRSYCCIEQGKVGLILSARPLERRALLEEAAGITGYREKKREAELKLRSAEDNLLRVGDIIHEVTQQMNSMKRQAARAERYRRVKEEMRGLQRVLYAHEFEKLAVRNGSLGEQLKVISDGRTSLEAALSNREARLEALSLSIDEKEKIIKETGEEIYSLNIDIERNRALKSHNRQTIEDLARRLEDSKKEIGDAQRRIQEMEESLTARGSKKEDLSARVRQLEKLVADRARDLEQVRARTGTIESEIEKTAATLFELSNAAAVAKNSIVQIGKTLSRIDETEARRQAEIAKVRGEIETRTDEERKTRRLLEAGAGAAESQKAEIARKSEEVDAVATQWEQGREAVRRAEERVKAAVDRVRALGELENLSVGAKKAAARAALQVLGKEKGSDKASFLADCIQPKPGFEKAVDSCLREVLEYVLVQTAKEGLQAVEALSRNDLGECSFLVRELCEQHDPKRIAVSLPPELLSSKQVKGWLHEFMEVGEPYRSFVRNRLKQTLLVDDVEAAVAFSRLCPSFTFVTVAGERVEPWGVLTGGQGAPHAGGLMTRRREKRDIEKAIPGMQAEARELAAKLGELERGLASARENLKGLEAEYREREKENAALALALQKVGSEIAALVGKREYLEGEIGELQESRQEHLAEKENCESGLALSASDIQERDKEGRRLKDSLLRSKEEEGVVAEAVGRIREELAGGKESEKSLETEIAGLRNEQERLHATRASLQNEIASLAKKREDLEAENTRADGTLATLLETLGRKREKSAAEEEGLKGLREERLAAEMAVKAERTKLDGVRERQKGLELEQAQIAASLENLRLRCLEDLGKAADELARSLSEDEKTCDLAARAKRLEDLKQVVEQFGPVNLMAPQEYQALVERHAFLTGQHKDLVESIASLRKSISQIEQTTRVRFQDAFEKVNENFNRNFCRLFGGGRGFLKLTDEEDLLNTGVEVVVQPPGKRLQNILLLSGGEKALAAISLLFALFDYRPSPFYVLDEVDAPLDEANINRFLDLLQEVGSRQQFILITHSKKTMKAAETLYGITMEEPGVSKVVSVQWQGNGKGGPETHENRRRRLTLKTRPHAEIAASRTRSD
jgi:chromosome segregation protein